LVRFRLKQIVFNTPVIAHAFYFIKVTTHRTMQREVELVRSGFYECRRVVEAEPGGTG
jgi:hypothetical protein